MSGHDELYGGPPSVRAAFDDGEIPPKMLEYFDRGSRERNDQRIEIKSARADIARLDAGQLEMLDRLDANTRATVANAQTTEQIQKNTAEIVAVANALKGFAKVCGWIGGAVRRVAWFALPGGSIYVAYMATKDFLKSIGKS